MRPANLVQHDVEIHTVTLRVHGTLHARAGIPMTRILTAGDRPHLSLTNARLYATGVEHPPAPHARLHATAFAAIPKDAIVWLAGGQAEVHPPGLGLEPRESYLVFPTFVLAGAILMRPEVRFSDAIGTAMLSKPIITLHEARVLDRRSPDTPLIELPPLRTAGHVTVDLRKATAIVDRAGGAAPPAVAGDDNDALIDDHDIGVSVNDADLEWG